MHDTFSRAPEARHENTCQVKEMTDKIVPVNPSKKFTAISTPLQKK